MSGEDAVICRFEALDVPAEPRDQLRELLERTLRSVVLHADAIDDAVVVVRIRMVVRDALTADRHHLPVREQCQKLLVDDLEPLVGGRRLGARTKLGEHARVLLDEPASPGGRDHERSLRGQRATIGRGDFEGASHLVLVGSEEICDGPGGAGLLHREAVEGEQLDVAHAALPVPRRRAAVGRSARRPASTSAQSSPGSRAIASAPAARSSASPA